MKAQLVSMFILLGAIKFASAAPTGFYHINETFTNDDTALGTFFYSASTNSLLDSRITLTDTNNNTIYFTGNGHLFRNNGDSIAGSNYIADAFMTDNNSFFPLYPWFNLSTSSSYSPSFVAADGPILHGASLIKDNYIDLDPNANNSLAYQGVNFPEPASITLMIIGCMGLVFSKHKFRQELGPRKE